MLNAHLLLLSIQLSASSKETRPNHNIVKALLVFWFKSLFTLFAEYSSAVTAFRQTVSPERGLPQPDLSCWAAAEMLLSLSIKWNPGYWVGPWDPSIEVSYGPSPLLALGHPHSHRTPVPLNPIVGTSLLPLPPELLTVPAGHIWQHHQESKHTESEDSHSVPAWLSSYNFILANRCNYVVKVERLKNLCRSCESNLCQFVIYSNHLRFAYLKNTLTKNICNLRSQFSLLTHNLPHVPLPSKSPWHTAKNGIN